MKYFQPTYTRIPNMLETKALTSRLGEYQQHFQFCLYAHASTDGAYQKGMDTLVSMNESVLLDAAQHVEEVFDTLDINTHADYLRHKTIISLWFDNTVYRYGKEYVRIGELWYIRDWKKVTVKAPKYNGAVLFFRDFCAKNADAVGLAVALDGKKIQTLKHGQLLELKSKRVCHGASKFLKKYKDKTDIEDLLKRREYSQSIDDQFTRERTEIINKLTKELLEHSRYVVFTQPLNASDAEYYERSGFFVVSDYLKLVAVMTRGHSNPFEYSEYDVRPLVHSFAESNQMHTQIAAAISKSLTAYAKARKTVK